MGETRVDLRHLLEDLQTHTGSIEETILTEVVANALDFGATRIRLLARSAEATLPSSTMDVACGTCPIPRRCREHEAPRRGIGFAGVGIKRAARLDGSRHEIYARCHPRGDQMASGIPPSRAVEVDNAARPDGHARP